MINVYEIIQRAIESGMQTDIGIINFVKDAIKTFLEFCGQDFLVYSGIPVWAIFLIIAVASIGKYFTTVDDSKLGKTVGKLSQKHPKLYNVIIYTLAASILLIVII